MLAEIFLLRMEAIYRASEEENLRINGPRRLRYLLKGQTPMTAALSSIATLDGRLKASAAHD